MVRVFLKTLYAVKLDLNGEHKTCEFTHSVDALRDLHELCQPCFEHSMHPTTVERQESDN